MWCIKTLTSGGNNLNDFTETQPTKLSRSLNGKLCEDNIFICIAPREDGVASSSVPIHIYKPAAAYNGIMVLYKFRIIIIIIITRAANNSRLYSVELHP